MTLGGLALAVGVLVDEATVEIENIHTPDAAGRLAGPRGGGSVQPHRHRAPAFDVLHPGGVRAFVLHGRRRPAALRSAVAGGGVLDDRVLSAVEQSGSGVLHLADEGRPSRRRARASALRSCLRALSRRDVCGSAGRWSSVYLAAAIGLVWVLLPRMGTEIFPESKSPLIRIRLRAPTGTRIEETERMVLRALDIDSAGRPARTMSRSPATSWAWCPPAIRWI